MTLYILLVKRHPKMTSYKSRHRAFWGEHAIFTFQITIFQTSAMLDGRVANGTSCKRRERLAFPNAEKINNVIVEVNFIQTKQS